MTTKNLTLPIAALATLLTVLPLTRSFGAQEQKQTGITAIGPKGLLQATSGNNATAKITIDEALTAARSKVPGYVNSALLIPYGPQTPGLPAHLVWNLHVVTTPPAGLGDRGNGATVRVDAQTGKIVDEPAPHP